MKWHPYETVSRNPFFNRAFVVTVILCVFLGASFSGILVKPVLASGLDDFETSATSDDSQKSTDEGTEEKREKRHDKREDEKEHARRHHDDSDDSFFAFLFEEFFEAMFEETFYLIYDGAKMSYARVGGATDIDPEKVDIRQNGEPTLPYVQFDCKQMYINSEIRAIDGRLEFGNGPVGFAYRDTYFTEDPGDHMNLSQYHLLLRMSPNRFQEYGIGIGRTTLRGNERHSGFSLTVPIKIYPKPSFGIYIKPTWSWIGGNQINDIDVGLAFTKKFATVELGYRFLEVNGQDLDGSYLGLAFHY